MYVDHFKLSERTFTNGPDTGFFMPNEQVSAAIARLRQVMLARDSVAIVTGGPGVGKSALIAAAQESLEDKAVVATVDLRQTDADLLTDMLLLRLGTNAAEDNDANALHRLRSAIEEHNQAGRQVTAVIDVTGFTVERAKRVLQLIHMAGEPGGQLNIILVGPHALQKLLNSPALIHLRQRVCFRYRVRPLTVDEVHRYLEEQFERADTRIESVLDDGAANTVFRYVGGVPRLINTLMDSVMSEAAVRQASRVGPDLMNDVARELGWKPLAGNRPAATKLAGAPRPATAPPELSLEAEAAPKPVELSTRQKATPPELSLDQKAGPQPMSEATAMLLLDPPSSGNDDVVAQPANNFAKATDNLGDHPGAMPEMSADDTGATGMLRLEDLEAHFAETIFGEDANKAASDAVAAVPQIPEEMAS